MEIDAQKIVITLPDSLCVVIIGRNEGKRLESCINSVLAAGAETVVYVDSQSTDGSVELATDYNLHIVELGSEKPLSAARARNAGVVKALKCGKDIDYIHFIDGDCELDEHWLYKAVETLDSSMAIAVVCGRLREKFRNQTFYNKLCDMAWYLPSGEINSCGGIATIRASVFNEHNGYNESLIAGEEPEFYHRLRQAGHKIISLSDPMGTHDADMTRYSQWWTRSVRTGYSYANAKEWGRWANERRSLVIWGGLYPLILIISCFISPLMSMIGLVLFLVQIYRIYLKLQIPYSKNDKFLYACFCMFDKFPGFLGFLKYHYVKITDKDQKIIEYRE